jgi:hypothetical protein
VWFVSDAWNALAVSSTKGVKSARRSLIFKLEANHYSRPSQEAIGPDRATGWLAEDMAALGLS